VEAKRRILERLRAGATTPEEAWGGWGLELQVGSLEASLPVREGAHRLWVGLGHARLPFLPGSSVAAAQAQAGHGAWEGHGLGDGRAHLEARVRLGHREPGTKEA
jgi:hypothetical protein